MPSIEGKDVVFDKKSIFAVLRRRGRKKRIKQNGEIQIKLRESHLSMMLELL